MPLSGAGAMLGGVLAAAVGAPPTVGGFFATFGDVVAAWAIDNIAVNSTGMTASGGNVSGVSTFSVSGDPEQLGAQLADAMTIPPSATDARAKWVAVAKGIVDHFNSYGIANGTGLTSGTPCGGAGTVTFGAPTFVPPLFDRLGVTEPASAAALEAFAVQLVSFLRDNALIVGPSLVNPPGLSAPSPAGAATGTGSLA